MALTPGTRIGAYEVVALLGEGGMGQVYRARDGKLNREVALKILPELFTADPDRLARFRREAQVLASLNHLDRLQVTTEPVQVLDGVVTKPSGAANFAVSRDGTLAYLPGRAPTLSFNVALMDRTGLLTQVPVPARAYRGLRASPNGRLLAGSIETESAADNEGVWTIDLARATSDRLTPPGVVATTPVWHPQGEAIAYWSPPGKEPGGIFQIATTGTGSPQRLTTSTSARHLPTSWSLSRRQSPPNVHRRGRRRAVLGERLQRDSHGRAAGRGIVRARLIVAATAVHTSPYRSGEADRTGAAGR